MPLLKTMTVDEFYTEKVATQIAGAVWSIPRVETEYGFEIQNFNMFDPDSNEVFSNVMNKKVIVDPKTSGSFRIPMLFVHFESFKSIKDWKFAVALQESTFNIFEHKTGATTALDGYQFNYGNLFEWDLTINHVLKPGQGIFFRPWLFHSFNQGMIQINNIEEV